MIAFTPIAFTPIISSSFGMFFFKTLSLLIALHQSHREGNWDIHLSDVRCAIPLFFFNRTNYKRWVPLYFEDVCLWKSRFPDLWENFCNGSFVHQTLEKGSGISSGGPAIGVTGVTGFTKQKQAVCKRNIKKKKKSLFTEGLAKICTPDAEDQYSRHHDLSKYAPDRGKTA